MKKGILLLVSILFFGVSAMADEVASITLNLSTFDLTIGKTHTLNATVLPAGADQTVTWETSDDAVASVANGVVTAKTEGSATIKATAVGGKTASCVVTVKTTVPVETITIAPAEITLAVNEGKELDLTVLPLTATDNTVSWDSSNPSVASVDTDGKVTALASGTTVITAKANDINGVESNECTVTVKVVTGITIPLTLTLNSVGDEETLTRDVEPSTATGYTINWISSDPSVATVDADGKVKAIKGGNTNITASVGDVTSNVCAVTVKVPVTGVTLPSTISVVIGKTQTLTADIQPVNATNKNVSWSSGDSQTATVSNQGLVTGVKAGTTKIKVTTEDGTHIAECEVNVTAAVAVEGIKFDKTTLTLNVDSVATLKASFTPSNATNKAVSFTQSTNVIEVISIKQDTIIEIKALKAGTSVITVKTKDGDKTATCTITVPPVIVTKVQLDKKTASLAVGDSVTLKVTITPSNATENGVTWASEDPKIATVSTDGKVKAIAVGKTRVIVTSKSDVKIKDTCNVEVTAEVIPVTSVQLNKDSISIIEGDTFHLKAAILPATATNRKVTWESKNTTIATVDANGIVTAKKAGKTTVIVTTENSSKKDTCIVNVREKVILIDPVITAQGDKGSIPLSLNVPDKETLTGTFTLKLPAGVTLDKENTKLTDAFAASSSLTISGGSNNIWKVEIKKKDLKSMLLALSNQKILDIAYTITKNVKKGDLLDVSIENAEFKFTDNTEIKEEGMTFKLKADYTTSNNIIDGEKAYAYIVENRLYIQSAKAETIYVYSLNGTLLYSGEKAEGKFAIDLNIQEPIIIVKGNSGWTQKVAK